MGPKGQTQEAKGIESRRWTLYSWPPLMGQHPYAKNRECGPHPWPVFTPFQLAFMPATELSLPPDHSFPAVGLFNYPTLKSLFIYLLLFFNKIFKNNDKNDLKVIIKLNIPLIQSYYIYFRSCR